MKSRPLVFGITLTVLLIAGLGLWLNMGQHPFAQLEESQIQSVHVRMIPPSVQYELSEDEITEFCTRLQDVVTYRTFSPEPMVGQFVEFTILLQDGTTCTVQPFGKLITIDGVSYKAAYSPSEALNAFANKNIPA